MFQLWSYKYWRASFPYQNNRTATLPKSTKIVKDEYIYDNFDFLNNSNTPTFTHDYFEYEQGGADIIVKGRLKVSIQFLIDIGAYHFIIDTIRDGYKIPFYSSPPSVYVSNNVSGSMNANFEDTAIQDWLNVIIH